MPKPPPAWVTELLADAGNLLDEEAVGRIVCEALRRRRRALVLVTRTDLAEALAALAGDAPAAGV